MIAIQATWGTLAEISEQSPGYSVQVLGRDGSLFTITELHYRVRPSGRRNRAYVQATATDAHGRPSSLEFDATDSVRLLD
jgi:hypothetical protein